MDVALRLKDSLSLSTDQERNIMELASKFRSSRNAEYSELAAYLASRHGNYRGMEVRERWHGSILSVRRSEQRTLANLRSLLTKQQCERLPYLVRQRLEVPDKLELGDRPPLGVALRSATATTTAATATPTAATAATTTSP